MLIPAEYYELSLTDVDATYITLTARITENGAILNEDGSYLPIEGDYVYK